MRPLHWLETMLLPENQIVTATHKTRVMKLALVAASISVISVVFVLDGMEIYGGCMGFI